MTDAKTAYDLQETSDAVRSAIEEFKKEQDLFFRKFDSTIFACNMTIQTICKHLGLSKATFFVRNVDALDELMISFDFRISSGGPDDFRRYIRDRNFERQELVLKKDLFDADGILKDIRQKNILDMSILWTTEEDSDDLPF